MKLQTVSGYTKVSISAITQCLTKDLKITNIGMCLAKPLNMIDLIFKQLLVMSLILTIMNVTEA